MGVTEKAGPYSNHFSRRFLEILEGLHQDEELLKEKVETKRRKLLAEGIPEARITSHLVKSFVQNAVIRSTTAGIASSLPVTLPFIGVIPTFLVAVSANTLFVFKNEIELCYLIAFSKNTELDSQNLKHRVFWLVGLSDFEEIKSRAKIIGVKLTLKKLVEKLAVISLSRGLAHFLHHGLGRGMGISVEGSGKTVSFFVGAPINAFHGYRSTKRTAQRAIKYFEG